MYVYKSFSTMLDKNLRRDMKKAVKKLENINGHTEYEIEKSETN